MVSQKLSEIKFVLNYFFAEVECVTTVGGFAC